MNSHCVEHGGRLNILQRPLHLAARILSHSAPKFPGQKCRGNNSTVYDRARFKLCLAMWLMRLRTVFPPYMEALPQKLFLYTMEDIRTLMITLFQLPPSEK